MKKIISVLVFIVSLSFELGAVQKIVMINENKDFHMVYQDLQKIGGKIIRELKIINAVVVDFPDYVKDIEIYSLGFVKSVEEDRYVKWIEENDLIGFADVKDVIRIINENNYTLPEINLKIDIPKLTDEEAKEIPWGVKRVNAYSAWQYTTGKGVDVAVIDTGIDYNHPDLKANYKGGYNVIDPSKPPLDDQGHGTHVSGTIAAIKDLKGVVGIAPDVNLYAVKVLDSSGSGQYSWVISGIEWAVNNKMKVINMSLGSRYGSNALKEAVKKAYEAGIVVVCAAGNDGGAVNYPAAYVPYTFAISASDSSDKIASFSSRGPEITFIAPGVSIYSTYKGGGYKTASGTSMASPHVAGLAALVVGLGVKGPDNVKNVLIKSAVKLPNLSDKEQGNGLIDAGRIYQVVRGNK